MTNLGTLGGLGSSAAAINPAGEVVGESQPAPGELSHAFLWQKGVMTDLGTLGGGTSYATGINPAGQVVRWSHTTTGETHAFLWEKGVMSDWARGWAVSSAWPTASTPQARWWV